RSYELRANKRRRWLLSLAAQNALRVGQHWDGEREPQEDLVTGAGAAVRSQQYLAITTIKPPLELGDFSLQKFRNQWFDLCYRQSFSSIEKSICRSLRPSRVSIYIAEGRQYAAGEPGYDGPRDRRANGQKVQRRTCYHCRSRSVGFQRRPRCLILDIPVGCDP